jgi:SAM-dependent methyltransferase
MDGVPDAADDYVALAQDYAWLASDAMLSGTWTIGQYAPVLAALPPDAAILDCSCGIGIDVIALARRGYRVWASDGSAAMVAQTRERAQHAGVQVPVRVCRWEDLPACYDRRFALVLCTGNSIVHAETEAAMVAALRGMHAVLQEGGVLVLATRNWEKLRAECPRVVLPERPSVRGGVRCLPIYIWTVPEAWTAPHTAEIVLAFERDGRFTHRRHVVNAVPFRVEDLLTRLQLAGFATAETDHAAGGTGTPWWHARTRRLL